MKVYSDIKPEVLEKVKHGYYRYHYNIKEVEMQMGIGEDNKPMTIKQWEYDEVSVYDPISSNKILEKVIENTWDNNYENKLINEYNAAKMGLYDADVTAEKEANYKAFLGQRAALKEQVDSDCKTLNIQ